MPPSLTYPSRLWPRKWRWCISREEADSWAWLPPSLSCFCGCFRPSARGCRLAPRSLWYGRYTVRGLCGSRKAADRACRIYQRVSTASTRCGFGETTPEKLGLGPLRQGRSNFPKEALKRSCRLVPPEARVLDTRTCIVSIYIVPSLSLILQQRNFDCKVLQPNTSRAITCK